MIGQHYYAPQQQIKRQTMVIVPTMECDQVSDWPAEMLAKTDGISDGVSVV